jgi:hypothetical protein
MALGGWSSPQMALRYEHATKERDRFIAHAVEALSHSAPEALDTPIVTAYDQEIAHVPARRPSDEGDALPEMPSD